MNDLLNDLEKILFTEDDLKKRVRELGESISEDFKEDSSPILLVGILKGASFFLADLAREINLPTEIDFMSVSSYGRGKVKSTGVVKILKDLDEDIEGKNVIIVEDLIDSGLTLSYLRDMMVRRGAKTVKIATLLNKKAKRKKEVNIDYEGFEVPDDFIVGYGIDYSEKYRNLKVVGYLKKEIYSK